MQWDGSQVLVAVKFHLLDTEVCRLSAVRRWLWKRNVSNLHAPGVNADCKMSICTGLLPTAALKEKEKASERWSWPGEETRRSMHTLAVPRGCCIGAAGENSLQSVLDVFPGQEEAVCSWP